MSYSPTGLWAHYEDSPSLPVIRFDSYPTPVGDRPTAMVCNRHGWLVPAYSRRHGTFLGVSPWEDGPMDVEAGV